MKRGLFALVLTLAACAPSFTPMSKDEAKTVLDQFATGHAPADACTDEGRMMLRSAAHAYADALYKEGRVWPDMHSLMGDGAENQVNGEPNFSNLDAFVLGAVISGFIKPSDLRGPGAALTNFINLAAAHSPASPATPAQLQYACNEVFALHQATARYVVVAQRHAHAMQLAERRGDWRRERQLRELYGHSDERAAARLQRLEEQLERKIAEAPREPSSFRP